MRRVVFVLIMAICLLIFGCVGAPSTQQPAGGAAGGETGAPSGGTGGEAEGAGAAGTEGAATGGATGGAAGGATGGGTTDYSGMAYLELAALGAPVECDITTTVQGTVTTGKLYMQGENKIRYEYNVEGKNYVMLNLDGTTYMTNTMADEYPECQWLKIEPEETQPGQPGEYGPSAPSLEDVPETSFNCRAWLYDGSKFAAPSNACTMDEFMAIVMQGYQ